MKKLGVGVLVILSIVFLLLAIYYFVTPADKVPDVISSTVSGYHAGRTGVNVKHGLVAVILAVGSAILAWFVSGNKSTMSKTNEPTNTEK